MKFRPLPIIIAAVAAATSAYRLPLKQTRRPTFQKRGGPNFQLSILAATDDNSLDLNSVHDMIYTADMILGGTNYSVQLDTGSSDLWIKGSSFPLANVTHTSLTHNVTYGIGWAFGNISYALVEFADFSIPSQAFVDISSADNPTLGLSADGIAGLGFTSLSQVDFIVNTTGSSAGRSLLYNIFSINPKEPNFISFSLQRATESDDQVEGIFAIGEYEPQYAAVMNQTAIPTWPKHSPSRWDVLLDAVIVNHLENSVVVPSTTVVGAPDNKAVVLLDNGSSYTYAPWDICAAIYSTIPGAYFDHTINYWVLPCDYEVDMALQIGGEIYPIHPLDVGLSGRTNQQDVCVGSFLPQNVSVGAGQFDWLVGDNVLRSVYSVYDFGDFDEAGNMGEPYVKLLSIVNPDEASADFHKARGGQANTNITYQGLGGTAILPSFSLSQDVNSTLAKISVYLPALLAIVALNAVVLIILLIAGAVIYCRRRRRSSVPVPARIARGRLSPMPLNTRHSYIADSGLPPPNQLHVYEPVSMALTDDTFIPPSPAFHKFEGPGLSPGDRPKSVA